MKRAHRQIIAEKISSTVRILELLGFEYEVAGPKRLKASGNKSPRVVTVMHAGVPVLRVYNGTGGHTWANRANGEQAKGIDSPETLYLFLSNDGFGTDAASHTQSPRRAKKSPIS
jgi:hypothetical protein